MSRIEEIKTRAWALREVEVGYATFNCKELAQDFEFLLAKLKLAEEALERYAQQRDVCHHDDGSWCDASCPDAGKMARKALAELRKA